MTMYKTLYDAWKREKDNQKLQALPRDFYGKLVEYIRRIRQENRMLDQKSTKAGLVSQELSKTKQMMEELARLRFTKIVSSVSSGEPLDKGTLTIEEESLLTGLKPSFEKFQSFLKAASRGNASETREPATPPKRIMLRFTQKVPAIVGVDLKVWGPFLAEDVAALPIENAKVLIKRGVAMEIETR